MALFHTMAVNKDSQGRQIMKNNKKSTIKVSKVADITCVLYFKSSETPYYTFVIVH